MHLDTIATIVTIVATIAGFYTATHRDIGNLRSELKGDIDRLDGRIARLDGRIDRLDGRIDRLETRIDRLDDRVYGLAVGLKPLIEQAERAT